MTATLQRGTVDNTALPHPLDCPHKRPYSLALSQHGEVVTWTRCECRAILTSSRWLRWGRARR